MNLGLATLFTMTLFTLAAPSIAQQPQRFTPSGTLKYMPLLEGWVSVRESPFGEVFQRDPKTPPKFAIAYVNEFDPSVDKNTDDLVADVRANFAKFVQIPYAAILKSVVVAKTDRRYPCAEAKALLKADGQQIEASPSTNEVQMRFVVCRDMRKHSRGFVVGISHTDEKLPEGFGRQTQEFLNSVQFRKE